MAVTWETLAELRARGQKPGFSLVITTWPRPWRPHAAELFQSGVMVISHEAGKPIPVQLLDGLDVILALDSCTQSRAVCDLLRRRGITARVRGWCACFREFTAVPDTCDSTREQVTWLENYRAA